MRLSTLLRSTALAAILAAGAAAPALAQHETNTPAAPEASDDAAPTNAPADDEPAGTSGDAPAEDDASAEASAPEAELSEGAQALRDSLVPYLSQPLFDQGVFRIEDEGGGYRITLDVAPLVDSLDLGDGSVAVAPYSVLVSERPDGNWDVASEDPLLVNFAFELEGVQNSFDYEIVDQRFTGVWSPSLGTFLSGEGTHGSGTLQQTDAQGEVDATFESGSYTIRSRQTGVGELDQTVEQAIDGFEERIVTPEDPNLGVPSFEATIAMTRLGVDAAIESMRSRALLDLWAFFVPRIDTTGERIVADQEELRERLRAVLPLWRNIEGGYDARDLSVTTAFGSGSLDEATLRMDFDGISGGGSYTYAIGFDGLELDVPLAPDWAIALAPQAMSLAFSAREVDLKTPVDIALDTFDLSTDDVFPPEAVERMAASFQNDPPVFVLEPGFVRGADYEVTYEGEVEIEGDSASTRSVVSARGIDAVIARLQEAGTNEAFTAVGSLNFAKGFAETLPDGRLRWTVETTADGAVSINGQQLVAPTVPDHDSPPTPDADDTGSSDIAPLAPTPEELNEPAQN